MTNLYEEGKFGGIPSSLIVERIRTGETDRQETTLFTCELLDGFNTVDEQGNMIRKESSQTLYIDGEKIDCEIYSEKILCETLEKAVYNYYTNRQRLLYSFFFSEYYIEDSHFERFKEAISNRIYMFLFYDFLRMRHYKNEKKVNARTNILKERERELKELSNEISETLFPESIYKQEDEYLSKDLNKAQKSKTEIDNEIDELTKHLKELENKKKEMEINITNLNFLIDHNKQKEAYSEAHGEITQYIDCKTHEVFEVDERKNRDNARVSQKAHIEEFAKEQENIRQELESKAQEEESSIPEEIRRKARYFLDKGYIKEEKGHYVVDNGFTGQEIAWINKYKLKDLGKDYFTINEMALYIWKNKTEPYKKSNFTSLKTPNKSIED